MKRLMIIGGMLGFAIGMALGSSTEGADGPTVLWRSSVACVAGGVLLRWWGRVWVRCLRDAHLRQQEALLANLPSPTPAAVGAAGLAAAPVLPTPSTPATASAVANLQARSAGMTRTRTV